MAAVEKKRKSDEMSAQSNESALDVKAPSAKKAKTQYAIFKDLVKAAEKGKTAKEITKIVQTESARIKKTLGSGDDAYSRMWRRAREMEAAEAANLRAATAAWADAACDEALALFASTPAAADDFAALDFVVGKVATVAKDLASSGGDAAKVDAASAELAKARATLRGFRGTACAATVDGVVAALEAAAGGAALAAAEARGAAWLARFRDDGAAAAVARVAAAHARVASALAADRAAASRASGEKLATGVAAACAAAADVTDLGVREATLVEAAKAIATWQAENGAAADAETAARVAAFDRGLARAVKQVRNVRADAALASSLRGAADAALMAHCAEFRDRGECVAAQVAEITALRAFKAKAEAGAEKAAKADAKAASALPAAVGRALSAQMTFFKGLKDGTKAISFALAGVQPDAFRAAFGDGAGLTRTVAGAALGINPKVLKPPVPGAEPPKLVLAGDVKLKLAKNELSATAAYKLDW